MAEMFKKINEALSAAMKAKDTFRLEVIRMMKSKILNVNARGDLPDAEIIKILQKYAKSLKDAIEETKKVNRPEAVAKLEGGMDARLLMTVVTVLSTFFSAAVVTCVAVW